MKNKAGAQVANKVMNASLASVDQVIVGYCTNADRTFL
jgi:hypothetical protein